MLVAAAAAAGAGVRVPAAEWLSSAGSAVASAPLPHTTPPPPARSSTTTRARIIPTRIFTRSSTTKTSGPRAVQRSLRAAQQTRARRGRRARRAAPPALRAAALSTGAGDTAERSPSGAEVLWRATCGHTRGSLAPSLGRASSRRPTSTTLRSSGPWRPSATSQRRTLTCQRACTTWRPCFPLTPTPSSARTPVSLPC